MTHYKKKLLPEGEYINSGNPQFPRRTARPKPIERAGLTREDNILWIETVNALWPWRLGEYPGYSECAAVALSYAKSTIRRWLSNGSRPIPANAAFKLATLLRSKATVYLQLAERWQKYGDETIERGKRNAYPGFRNHRLDEKDGWRSNPRKRVR